VSAANAAPPLPHQDFVQLDAGLTRADKRSKKRSKKLCNRGKRPIAMDFLSGPFWLSVLQIVWIDLLLSGDNAVVIALACRSLPEKQRKLGIWLGAGAAITLRIIFALIVSYLMGLPFLKIIGGLLLFWIAIKLVVGDEDGHESVEGSDSLWRAVRTIAIADAVMSLDNVIAIAAASRGHPELFVFGLLLSIPLIIYGSQMIITLLTRYPFLIWLGAALLGWIAGEMIVSDTAMLNWWTTAMPGWVKSVPLEVNPLGKGPADVPHYGAAVIGAAIVVAAGYLLSRRRVAAASH
jgi:YjbE family integral membrane protein